MKVIDTSRDATSDAVSTIGSEWMNLPVSPGRDRNGR